MGTSIDKKLPRGYRNNNFGNLRRSNDQWQGLRPEQTDPQFFQFTAPEWGYRALLKTLRTYRKKHDLQTVSELISRWAPANENNTAAYIRSVCQEMQVPDSYIPDMDDKGTMCALAAAISRHENGVDAVMEDIERGWGCYEDIGYIPIICIGHRLPAVRLQAGAVRPRGDCTAGQHLPDANPA